MKESKPVLYLVGEGHHAHDKTINSPRGRSLKLTNDPNSVGIVPMRLLSAVECEDREQIER
eukprot:scaffold24197_cov51-Attheya_sp.AAC.2